MARKADKVCCRTDAAVCGFCMVPHGSAVRITSSTCGCTMLGICLSFNDKRSHLSNCAAGEKLRCVGSALSPNGLAFSPEGMLSLALLDQVMHIDKQKQQITVQAGARVQEVGSQSVCLSHVQSPCLVMFVPHTVNQHFAVVWTIVSFRMYRALPSYWKR